MLIGLHRKRECGIAPLTRTIGSDDVLLLDSSRPHHWGCLGIGGREVPRPRGICRGARDLSHRSCRLVMAAGMVGDRRRCCAGSIFSTVGASAASFLSHYAGTPRLKTSSFSPCRTHYGTVPENRRASVNMVLKGVRGVCGPMSSTSSETQAAPGSLRVLCPCAEGMRRSGVAGEKSLDRLATGEPDRRSMRSAPPFVLMLVFAQ